MGWKNDRKNNDDARRNLEKRRFFIDSEVIEDGKEYIQDKKGSQSIGRHSFEYYAGCWKLDEIAINRTINATRNEIGITIIPPNNEKLQGFWPSDPPYTGFITITYAEYHYFEPSLIFHNGFLGYSIENGTFVLNDIYLIIMSTMTGSSHLDMGNGHGVEQFVILSSDLTPILIIANRTEWVA